MLYACVKLVVSLTSVYAYSFNSRLRDQSPQLWPSNLATASRRMTHVMWYIWRYACRRHQYCHCHPERRLYTLQYSIRSSRP